MITKRIQDLATDDLNIIHNLENLVKLRIDKVLCSEKLGGIRFLPTETLNTCQKHIFMNLYVCTGREILMKFENPIDCHSLDKLPKSLVIEKNENEFIIDSKEPILNIYCNGKINKAIKPKNAPMKVTLPKHCKLESKLLKISNISDNIGKINNITIQEPDIRIIRLKPNFWKPYENDIQKGINDEVFDEGENLIKHLDDYDEIIDNDQKIAKQSEKELDDINGNSFSILEITGLVIALVAISMVMLLLIKVCSIKPVHCCEPDKVKELELRICGVQKELDQFNNKRQEMVEILSKFENESNEFDQQRFNDIIREFKASFLK